MEQNSFTYFSDIKMSEREFEKKSLNSFSTKRAKNWRKSVKPQFILDQNKILMLYLVVLILFDNVKSVKLHPVELKTSDDKVLCDLELRCPALCNCKELIRPNTNLIDCSARNLTSEDIPELDAFQLGCAKIGIILDLSDNKISDFNSTIFIKHFLNNTNHINLSGNNLTSTLFLEQLDDHHNTTFSIGRNPFPCSKFIGFQILLSVATRVTDISNITCINTSNDRLGEHERKPLYVQQTSKTFQKECSTSTLSVLIPVIAIILLALFCLCLFVLIISV